MLGLPEPDELDALAPNSLPAIPENHTGIALHNGAISADGLHQGAGLVSNGASFSKFMTMLMDKIADKDVDKDVDKDADKITDKANESNDKFADKVAHKDAYKGCEQR